MSRFDTISFRELWNRIGTLVNAWTNDVAPGDRVCVLGFTSVDYTTIDVALGMVGPVSVPLQAGAAIAQLCPIVVETKQS